MCPGVYYKLVGPYTDDIIVVIPGLFLNRVNASASEAFVSVVHNAAVNYYRFPVSAFKSTPKASGFSITIGDSTFTDKGITLSIMPDADDDAKDTVMAEISFEDQTPWTVSPPKHENHPRTRPALPSPHSLLLGGLHVWFGLSPVCLRLQTRLLHPSTMGVLGYLTGLECYHHVLSLHHKLHGYISVGEALTDLEMGTGYLEKDWGSTFPRTWIWAQSNHFALLKPPKRGNGAGGVEGEVWAESEENREEIGEEGAPGSGESSGAVSALYADHIHNHERPVSIFLSVARVPLPAFAGWVSRLIGWSSPAAQAELSSGALQLDGAESADAHSVSMGFVVGFLFERQLNVFASYQLDSIVRFDVEEGADGGRDEGKQVVHLSFVDAARTRRLDVALHKPVQINAAKRRKKDTECLKKAVAQKNRERERLGVKLNPLEEAFLMDDINKRKAEDAAQQSPEAAAAEKAAMEAGIAAAKAANPQAQLDALYAKPVAVPAPIVAGLYGPRAGRMEKFVKESLIGGRIEVAWSELRSASSYAAMSSKERKSGAASGGVAGAPGQPWTQQIVGQEIMYSSLLYRAIAKPAAMEVQGDVEWLQNENDHHNSAATFLVRTVAHWLLGQPHVNAVVAAATALALLAGAMLLGLTRASANKNKVRVSN